MRKIVYLLCVIGFSLMIKNVGAQVNVNVRDSAVFVPMFMPTIGFHFPLGDVQQRYKFTYHVGGQFLIKNKKNWLYGVSGEFIFGENVDEPNLLQNIFPIYGTSGITPSIGLGMRGFNFMAQGGKIVPVGKKPNRNSGLIFMFGAGFLQHQIFMQFKGDDVPQANQDYIKGYDRLHNGFAMSQFIGYMYLGNNRTFNFLGGVEVIQAFTRNRRTYNYDQASPDIRDKYDFFIGLKVAYIFPFYRKGTGATNKQKDKEYYYQ